jgi:hypothetical protein
VADIVLLIAENIGVDCVSDLGGETEERRLDRVDLGAGVDELVAKLTVMNEGTHILSSRSRLRKARS